MIVMSIQTGKKNIPPKQKRKINKNYLKVFKEKFCKDLLAKAA